MVNGRMELSPNHSTTTMKGDVSYLHYKTVSGNLQDFKHVATEINFQTANKGQVEPAKNPA